VLHFLPELAQIATFANLRFEFVCSTTCLWLHRGKQCNLWGYRTCCKWLSHETLFHC